MNEADVRHFEELCHQFYEPKSETERRNAEQALSAFTNPSSPEVFTQSKNIIEASRNPYALMLAFSCLQSVIRNHWNSFIPRARAELASYTLKIIARPDPVPNYVTRAIIKLFCYIVKRVWLEAPATMLIDFAYEFFSHSESHCLYGLQIFVDLVEGFNLASFVPVFTRTEHRKVAISFRNSYLLKVFKTSLSFLKTVVGGLSPMDSTRNELKRLSLQLAERCLLYDFIGTNPDESAGDTGTVQIPTNWRELFVDSSTTSIFFSLYGESSPPMSTQALRCIVQLSSIRRSLFSKTEEREDYLTSLIRGTTLIIANQTGLDDKGNHHELCRLLARLKANFQLTQLVNTPGYPEWINVVASFTTRTMNVWHWAPHSIYYLLTLWSRLVASMAYLKGGTPSYLDRYAPAVFEAYVNSRIDTVEHVISGNLEDNPLTEYKPLEDQLESVPFVARCDFDVSCRFLINHFDPLLTSYQHVASGQMTMPPAELVRLEGRLAWLVYFVGSVIGGRMNNSHDGTDSDVLDGELAARGFQLMRTHEERLKMNGVSDQLEPLEMAILFFMGNFRRVYIGEHAISSKVYKTLHERLQLSDHKVVLTGIVTKLIENLRFWVNNEAVIGKTLKLFRELASGFSSSKLLIKLDIVPNILQHHTEEYFPFLSYSLHSSRRSTYYTILGKLLFVEQFSPLFETFMAPFEERLANLLSVGSVDVFRSEECRNVLIGVLRDLRGILAPVSNKAAYRKIFNWLYPRFMPVFVRAAEAFFDTPEVVSPLLAFISELVYNKTNRIQFGSASPNGILLFREASKVLVAYGNRILMFNPSRDVYSEKLKGVWKCMEILTRSLRGNYVNFGVFALYGDAALSDALSVVIQSALAIPLDEVMAYKKLAKAYFGFLEALCGDHTAMLVQTETPIFLHILMSIRQGISGPSDLSAACASALNQIGTYFVENRGKDDDAGMIALMNHLSSHPTIFNEFLELIFKLILFGETATSLWALSRPLLVLIVLDPDHYQRFQSTIVGAQEPRSRERLSSAFANTLMKGVNENLLPKNRDKFTQNLSTFKAEVKTFIT